MKKTETLTYKVAERKHHSGILSLWKNHSEWGEVSAAQLESWLDAPYENVIVLVALNEEEVLGQCFVTPARMNTNKGEVKCARVSAPIVHSELRGGNLLDPNHSINRMFGFAFQEAVKQRIELIYLYPLSSWVRVLKISANYGLPHFSIRKFSFYQAQIDNLKEATNYSSKLVNAFNATHQEIWNAFQLEEPCYALKRTEGWLKYKAGDFLKIQVNDGSNPVGLVVYNQKANLVYDAFAKTEGILPKVLKSALNYIFELGQIKEPYVKFLGTESLLKSFTDFNCNKIEFDHVFAVASLSERFGFEDLDESKWFLTSLE